MNFENVKKIINKLIVKRDYKDTEVWKKIDIEDILKFNSENYLNTINNDNCGKSNKCSPNINTNYFLD